ncbi:MAG: endonuclease/exonuclease/phosphatase family protein [Flavobacteriales bacterium]|nr:endonuclease/exonuclease/phosphatase family protein [Flavobacteriales bacterium]
MRVFIPVVIVLTLGLLQCCKSSEKTVEVITPSDLDITFYNVENLFDTIDDPQKSDEDFTPSGKLQWNTERYQHKLKNLARVISQDGKELPEVLGLCEVENRQVVEDLMKMPAFAGVDYRILHRESPDGRGIDVALAYNAAVIQFEEVSYIRSKLPHGDRPNTRLVLYARGMSGGDTLHVFVNHWPSRHGGQQESEPNRLTVAYNVDQVLDSIRGVNPMAKILMMGDFNDYPNNKSLVEIIQAGKDDDSPMINLMWDKHKMGEGSYNYRGEWGALDQFVVSPPLVSATKGFQAETETVEFVRFPWLMYVDKEGVAYPNRTYGGPNYYGGYSDHLSIHMKLTYIKGNNPQ